MKVEIYRLDLWRKERNIVNFPITIKDDMKKEVEEIYKAIGNNDSDNQAEEIIDVAIFALNGLGLLPFKSEFSFKQLNFIPRFVELEECIDKIDLSKPIHLYDSLVTIITLCKHLTEKIGYSFESVLNEKLNVISSRQQDPKQKEEWLKNGAKGKWLKNELQDPNTIHKADYSKCKKIVDTLDYFNCKTTH